MRKIRVLIVDDSTVIRDLVLDCEGEVLRIMMCEEDRTQNSRLSQRKLDAAASS